MAAVRSFRLLPLLGVVVAVASFGVATAVHTGGFDWNRDYLSTLLRAEGSPARAPAIAGMLLFCASIALVFERLARSAGSPGRVKAIRIGGIGSMVYAALTFTPMHDLMVTIAIAFFTLAMISLLLALRARGRTGFFVAGCLAGAVLLASAAIYYTERLTPALPWAQRLSFVLIAGWLLALDMTGVALRPVVTAHQ